MEEERGNQFDCGQLDLLRDCLHTKVAISANKTAKEDLESIKTLPNKPIAGQDKAHPPEKLLIIDTETTGLDPKSDNCLEVGAILFHVSTRSVISQLSFLLPVESNRAEAINKIPARITCLSQPWTHGLRYLQALIDSSELLVAHNAVFDKQWFGKEPLPSVSKRWLCTMEDISWPTDRNLRSRPSVRDLALAYGVPVWSAHRALTDCIYLAEVFKRCDELETLLIRGLEPKILLRADISYEQRHLAKNAGFRWNDSIQGAWSRRMSRRDIEKLEFPVLEIDFEN